MDPLKPRSKKGPEAIIQQALVNKLRMLGWLVKETHGNIYQSGFPDLFAASKRYGTRWIEVKNPKAYSFTPAQMETFPMFSAHGVGIWILISDHDQEINKLFGPANWYTYLK